MGAIRQASGEMEEAKLCGKDYVPYRYENGDTRKELLVRSRCLPFKSAGKWTDRQKLRAKILFNEYPDIRKAYSLCHSLRMIFSKNTVRAAARLSMAKWYDKVEKAGFHSFNVIAATFYDTTMRFSISITTALPVPWRNRSMPKSNFPEPISGVLPIRSSFFSELLNYMHIPIDFLLTPSIIIVFIVTFIKILI